MHTWEIRHTIFFAKCAPAKCFRFQSHIHILYSDEIKLTNCKTFHCLRSWLHRSPISANEWTNPNSKNIKGTGCYKTVSFSSKQKGDIIAFKTKRKSGHVGIVSTNGFYISALKRKVEEDNIEAFRRRHASIVKTIVWRYKC